VNYEVRNTSLGKGVFVLEDVKQGTLVWRYRKGENVICFNGEDETLAHMEKLGSFGEKQYFLEHSYYDNGVLTNILDDGKMVNHSDNPNTGAGSEPFATYALRDIKKGEELREDYATYEYPEWFLALCKDFGLDFSYVKM